MKVKELKKLLEDFDDNDLVVMSIDPEGNGFSELDGYSDMVYSDGEVGYAKLTPELEKQGYSEEDLLDGKRAIVLWP